MSVNKVILVGRLGQNPELKYTPSGASVANFSVATNEVWTDKQGQRQESTEWHRIVVWGKQAELCSQYLTKGREVYIEGRLQTRQWQDQSGQTRYTTEVVGQTIRFLGGASQSRDQASGGDYASRNGGAPAGGRDEASFGGGGPAFQGSAGGAEPSFTEDDIPF